jgi:hypothetical protein
MTLTARLEGALIGEMVEQGEFERSFTVPRPTNDVARLELEASTTSTPPGEQRALSFALRMLSLRAAVDGETAPNAPCAAIGPREVARDPGFGHDHR